MGVIKEFFDKQKLLQKEKLRKRVEQKKKEMESYPKCKNCGVTYVQELAGLNSYAHSMGFCNDNCMNVHLVKSVKIIRQHMMMMDKVIINLNIKLKKVIKYLISQRRQK